MKALAVTLISLAVMASEATTFPRCELAKLFKKHGLDGYHDYSLSNWICMVFFSSFFKNDHPLGNKLHKVYGLFMISNAYWCKDGKHPSRNTCRIACQMFLDDDLDDDIECAKKIVRSSSGMGAWPEWTKKCRGRNLNGYLKGCHGF